MEKVEDPKEQQPGSGMMSKSNSHAQVDNGGIININLGNQKSANMLKKHNKKMNQLRKQNQSMNLDDAQKIYKQPVALLQNPYNDFS